MDTLFYKDAGVDIDKGNELIDTIKPIAQSTNRPGVTSAIGGFGGLFDLAACGYQDPVLVSATDGVGTKLVIASAVGKHNGIGVDLVAMCVNDLIVQGAQPLFFLDYFATGVLDKEIASEVIKSIALGCKEANCALIGGETAEMPGMYRKGHYDLAGFAVGAVERNALLPKTDINEGDIVIGLASSGIHANGFSLIRYLVEKHHLDYHKSPPFCMGKTLADILLTPTKIYVSVCMKMLSTGGVKALAHITGGGLTENIPRILPNEYGVSIDCQAWPVPKIFTWLAGLEHIHTEELLRTFNCGIGMVIIIDPSALNSVEKILKDHGEAYYLLGHVTKKTSEKNSVHYVNTAQLHD